MSLLKSILSGPRGEERRQAPRRKQDCAVLLFKDGRPTGSARLLDISTGGARLQGPVEAIRSSGAFVMAATRKAYSYEVVHAGFGGVGVRITSSRSLTGRLPAAFEAMRRAID